MWNEKSMQFLKWFEITTNRTMFFIESLKILCYDIKPYQFTNHSIRAAPHT